MPIDTVIFDFGGVILRYLDPDWLRTMLPYGDQIQTAVNEYLQSDILWEVMRGRLREMDFWSAKAREMNIPIEAVERYLQVQTARAQLDSQVLARMAGLKGRYKLGILSNAGDTTRMLLQEHYRLHEVVDDIVISAEEGLVKPEPEIYLLSARRLGTQPERCVFVDDLPENIRAAERVGMRGVLFTDTESSLARLDSLLAQEA
ncbi:MAG: HAD family phosphatase [Chloroflexi bacterium]|jgi:epoxide hydrolase-like predicted phosphatase|nr:HAD family phosphatase [Anaerolineaceae bacterium]NLI43807.1 HAD family phosphatase [Chloroflexota bacterium]HOE35350.1 HAD family phosphatase [Anaerolineaceae bacterium]HOT25921.1 HAD family phosphatase [Anaerolineaceae bacterium]HQH58361.1 HAD family phosphatase [Anaerolineaceae bacterium]